MAIVLGDDLRDANVALEVFVLMWREAHPDEVDEWKAKRGVPPWTDAPWKAEPLYLALVAERERLSAAILGINEQMREAIANGND